MYQKTVISVVQPAVAGKAIILLGRVMYNYTNSGLVKSNYQKKLVELLPTSQKVSFGG